MRSSRSNQALNHCRKAQWFRQYSWQTYNSPLNGDFPLLPQIAEIQSQLEGQHYINDRAIATTVYLAMKLRKPELSEGQAGGGKTESARVVAAARSPDRNRRE